MSDNKAGMNSHEIKASYGLSRIDEVLKLYPISKSNWWRGVKSGKFPQPIKLSERTTAWYTKDIIDLIISATEATTDGGEK